MESAYHVTTIPLDDLHRLVVEYDADSEDPREWDSDTVSVHPVNLNPGYLAPTPGKDSHEDAIDAILEHHAETLYTGRGVSYRMTDEAEAALTKHFARAGLPFRLTELNADRDWVGLFLWYLETTDDLSDPDKYLDGCVGTYRQYAAGEVYMVSLEELTEWEQIGPDKSRGLRRSWESVESIGSIYLEEDGWEKGDQAFVDAATEAGLPIPVVTE